MNVIYILFCIFYFLIGIGCQQKPTVLSESGGVISKDDLIKNEIQNKFGKKSDIVVLDVRAPFDFEAFHLPGSLNLNLDFFLVKNDRGEKQIDADVFGLARRLSYLGIGPESSILIVGDSSSDQVMEKQAVAFLLLELKIEKVILANIQGLRANPFNQELPRSVEMWKPEAEKLVYKKQDLKELILKANPLAIFINVKSICPTKESQLPNVKSQSAKLLTSELLPANSETSCLVYHPEITAERFEKMNVSMSAELFIGSQNLRQALSTAYLFRQKKIKHVLVFNSEL